MDLTATLLEAALGYAARGWRIVPLRPSGKVPTLNAWQRTSSCHPEMVEHWWKLNPLANVGVQLGPRSGIVDVECDTAEAETALGLLIGDAAEPTCCFQASRGKHRLYKWAAGLPDQAVVKIDGVELRLGGGDKGAQSVFPPSVHESGAMYRWLVTPEECEPATLPKGIVARLREFGGGETTATEKKPRSDIEWERILEGVEEGMRNETSAAFCGKLLSELIDVFDGGTVTRAWKLIRAWNTTNKPPLDEKELETTYRSILNLERRKRTEDEFYPRVERDTVPAIGEAKTPEWNCIILESDPPLFRITSPLWLGYVELTVGDFLSVHRVKQCVLSQKRVALSKEFKRLWEGGKGQDGIAGRLIAAAEHERARAERRRDMVVAEGLWYRLARRVLADEDGNPDERGEPTEMPDGSIVFGFTRVWSDLSKSEDRILRGELSGVLEKVGSEDARFSQANRKRLTKLSNLAIRTLGNMLEIDETESACPIKPANPTI